MVKAVRGVVGALIGAGALTCLAGHAWADVKAGVDAWSAKDYGRAVGEWKAPAAAGDPDAQFNLAQAYKLGRGVPQDLRRAETLFASAAARGHMRAADNYGLLLFRRGERSQAMPYLREAAARGDPRAQYIVGLATFNGEDLKQDWLHAYAYVSLAQQAGLPEAQSALAQMDKQIPMAERQKSVALAAQLAARAEATRARQLAAVDLATGPGRTIADERGEARQAASAERRPVTSQSPSVATVERAVADAARVSSGPSASAAGADYARPRAPATPAAAPSPAPVPSARPQVRPATERPAPEKPPIRTGAWRLQLGAFGVPGNAEALWNRVRARPELSGHGKVLVEVGRLTKLQVTGFSSQGEANAACTRLKSAGFACLATRD